MRFEDVEGFRGCVGRGPEERVVVGEEGEEDAQEEGGCCASSLLACSLVAPGRGRALRQTIRNVAKEKDGMVKLVWEMIVVRCVFVGATFVEPTALSVFVLLGLVNTGAQGGFASMGRVASDSGLAHIRQRSPLNTSEVGL